MKVKLTILLHTLHNQNYQFKQDPRLQGRAPGFRQGQDRDKSGASQTRKKQGQEEGDGKKVKERNYLMLGGR